MIKLPKTVQLLQFNLQHIQKTLPVCDISSSLTEVQTTFAHKNSNQFLILTSRPQMDVASFCPAVSRTDRTESHSLISAIFPSQYTADRLKLGDLAEENTLLVVLNDNVCRKESVFLRLFIVSNVSTSWDLRGGRGSGTVTRRSGS